MADITIVTPSLSEVKVNIGSIGTIIEGEAAAHVVDNFSITFSLPFVIAFGRIHAALGLSPNGRFVGLDNDRVIVLPGTPYVDGDTEKLEIFNSTLTGDGSYDIIFYDQSHSIVIVDGYLLFYKVRIKDRISGVEKPLLMAISGFEERRVINLDEVMSSELPTPHTSTIIDTSQPPAYFPTCHRSQSPSRRPSLIPPDTEEDLLNSCAICLDSFVGRGITTRCNHTFCVQCIAFWLLTNRTCPTCRGWLPIFSQAEKKFTFVMY